MLSEWEVKGKFWKLPAGVVPKVVSVMYDRLEREPCAKAILYSPIELFVSVPTYIDRY